jgi:hypothetical protein
LLRARIASLDDLRPEKKGARWTATLARPPGGLRQALGLLASQRMAGTLVDLYAAAGLAR